MDPSADIELSEVERIKIDRTYERFQRMDYYEILNVPRTADRVQIKKSYYTVSKEYHPDRYFRRNLGHYKDRLESIFDLITKAYNTLNDETSRADYDKSLYEQSFCFDPPIHEVAMEVGTVAPVSTPKVEEATEPDVEKAEDAPPPTPRAQPLTPRAMPKLKLQEQPLFMQKIHQQIVGRMVKARGYFKSGKEAFEKEQYGIAVGHLQMALAYEPNMAEAKEMLDIATGRVNETKAEAHYQRAVQELTVGNTDNAKIFLKAAVECKPRRGHYYHKYAVLLLESEKDLREAVEQLKNAVEYSPRNVEYRMMLAKAYEDIDMPLFAKREYEKVVRIDKSNRQAQKSLKRLKAVT